jgi:hypothetical protein
MPVRADILLIQEAGRTEKTSYSLYRGEHTNLHPTDTSFTQPDIIDKIVQGMVPAVSGRSGATTAWAKND